jgi:hypothetical protein
LLRLQACIAEQVHQPEPAKNNKQQQQQQQQQQQ